MTGLDSSNKKWTIHVEVRLKPRATMRYDTLRQRVDDWLHSFNRINLASKITGWENIPELASSIEQIIISESPCTSPSLPLDDMALQIHVYQTNDADAFEEFSNTNSNGSGEEAGEGTMAASVCELPNRGWEGLWDSLVYADDVKLRLLDYIYATLLLSDADVDFNLVSWNRVVLLHGPPGTGKTSLCRALAQKLSIRLSQRYAHSRLLEINSHSLFSKWFSESGKLVQRLFTSIIELAEEEDTFLVVLIDEVESLTAARAGAMAGTEPSDGLRVVNALLTQLDKLKHRKNILIMSTSNLVKAIDTAFLDRADIVQYIDLPPREAVYEILRSCLCEFAKKGIVSYINVPTLQQAQMYELTSSTQSPQPDANKIIDAHEQSRNIGVRLLALASRCRNQEMSGRALRRLPVLALARYIGTGNIISPGLDTNSGNGINVELWLEGMEKVIADHEKEQNKVV